MYVMCRPGTALMQGVISRWLLAWAAFAAIAVTGLTLAALPANAAPLRTGCDGGRPAFAYSPGRGALSPQPPGRPIPCLAVIPERTSESATVAVAPSGRVFYAPLVENSYPAPLDDRGPARVTNPKPSHRVSL